MNIDTRAIFISTIKYYHHDVKNSQGLCIITVLLTSPWSFFYEQENLIFSEMRVQLVSDNIALCQGM